MRFTLSTFYKSKQWEQLVNLIKLERANQEGDIICEHCNKPIIKAYDCIGHHIRELTEFNVNDYNISLNKENVKLVHHKCHNIIHERFGYDGTRHIYLVYGSPCSGKRDYINEVASPEDIIIDIDSLYEAITIRQRYDHGNRVNKNVFVLRDTLIDMVKARTGKWRCAYLIGGYPLSSERERLSEALGAELIYIESTKEECLAKANTRPGDYKKYVEDWYSKYLLN